MAGNRSGGLIAKEKLLAKHGPDFFKRIGKLGGQKSYERGHLAKIGFAANRQLASEAGRKGGQNGTPYSKTKRPERVVKVVEKKPRAFAANRELARAAGRIGGLRRAENRANKLAKAGK